MQVFNLFFKIAKKQRTQFIIYFIIFGVLIVAMTGMGEGKEEYSNSRMDIAIFNNDGSAKANYLEQYLRELHDIKEVENDEEVIQDYLYYQVIDYVLYIDEGFKLSNIKRPGTTTGTYVDNHIANFEKNYDAYILAGLSPEEAFEKTLEVMDTSDLVKLKGKSGGKPTIFFFYMYFTYIILSLLITTLAPVIVAMNKKEVKNRAVVSPYGDGKRTVQMVLSSIIFALGIWLFLNVLSVVVCKGALFEADNLYYLLNSVAYLMVSAGIVCIVSSLDVKGEAISMVSNILALSFSFLGGVFVPMEIFGDTMMNVAKCMPTYWYVRGCYNISEGKIGSQLFGYMGIQMLFALAFFAVALVIVKRKRISRA